MKRCMAAAVLAMAGTAMAEEHFDLWLTLDGAGRLATGAISEDGSATALGVRVFGAELGGVLPNFADEPGMQSPDGTFEGGSRFGLSILRAVRVWDGTDFATVSASRFQVDFGPSSAASRRFRNGTA